MASVSLFYEILLDFNEPVLIAFFFGELISQTYKWNVYYEDVNTYVVEMVLLVLLGFLEVMRIVMGKKGNLLQRPQAMITTILLSIPSILGVLYFSKWQTRVLLLDVILAVTELTFDSLEAFYATYWCVVYMKYGSS